MKATEKLKEVNELIEKHDIKGMPLLFIEEDGVKHGHCAIYGESESIMDAISVYMDQEICEGQIRDIIAGAIIKAETDGVEVFQKYSKISRIISTAIEDYCRYNNVKF